jgi:hypothetical protein
MARASKHRKKAKEVKEQHERAQSVGGLYQKRMKLRARTVRFMKQIALGEEDTHKQIKDGSIELSHRGDERPKQGALGVMVLWLQRSCIKCMAREGGKGMWLVPWWSSLVLSK